LRSSFGSAASACARHRLDDALAAIEWVLEPVPVRKCWISAPPRES
jgi:hypothetical protein